MSVRRPRAVPLAAALVVSLAFASAWAAEPAPAAPSKPTDAEGWRALAQRDLDALRAALREHTPIPFDTENPAYARWLDDGYAQAAARLPEVRDEAGYFYTLAGYANGFHDPHISVSHTGELPAARWPGFVASARGDQAVVSWRDPNDPEAPAPGTTIERCDGEALSALTERLVFPFTLNAALPPDRRRAIARLFMDRGNPFAPPPSRCVVRDAGGTREIALRWRTVGTPATEYWAAYADAGIGPRSEFGLSEPAPGVFWIGVPTFASGKETTPMLQALIDAVAARGDALRQAKAIVIDTRGNGGGNSAWADRLAEAIFTRPVMDAAEAPQAKRRVGVDWRGSAGNVAYWQQWAKEQREELSMTQRMGLRMLAGKLESAARRQPPLWRQGEDETDPSGGLTTRRPRDAASPFPARVYVLSNGSCVSSCLNFADTVLMVPGVRLIGSSTSGDGPYMEVRGETLPSGLVELTLPQKVYRGMARGTLEVYTPDIAYDGAWDDASVRAWTMALIEAGR